MVVPLEMQILTVLRSILLGAGLAMFYDVLRAVRRRFRFGCGATALCDALFWMVTLCSVFAFFLASAAGQNRYYVFAGFAGGSAIWLILISPAANTAMECAFTAISRLFMLAENVLRRLYHGGKGWLPKQKFCVFAKNFGKTSSIFGRKGLK